MYCAMLEFLHDMSVVHNAVQKILQRMANLLMQVSIVAPSGGPIASKALNPRLNKIYHIQSQEDAKLALLMHAAEVL